jgi:hypothetical protein
MQVISESTHRQSLIDILTEDIRQTATDLNLTAATASARVLTRWLGYESEDVTFIDQHDRGIDAWVATGSGLDIFQVKTHELGTEDRADLSAFSGDGVRDIGRAADFILHEREINVQSDALKELLRHWASLVRNHKLEESKVAIPVTLHLVILGEGLTSEAKAEFQSLTASFEQIHQVDGVPVQFHGVLHTIDDIINVRWREHNRDWKDLTGKHFEQISLQPFGTGSISDNQNAIFYCKALDLVNAYDALGYQLFEPNVRANIKNSRVNQAIRDSVLHQRTRRDFRFLNNGVTIICDSFTRPSDQRKTFMARHPGIVNGLQTVVALHKAYSQLADKDKEDFEKHCAVLVRLLVGSAVDDISRVVKATNNQNPMKPRNLVSNNPEQLLYARIFADQLNWFYEAKEGAWDAFENDPKRWRPSLNKKPRDFQLSKRKVRRVDNEDLAQTWLAFIGFAVEAANDRKEIFDDRFYQLVFTKQTRKHGADYSSIASARDEAMNQSPSAHLMLAAYLCRKFAEDMTPGAAQNRQQACNRLGIDPARLSRAELDSRLNQDQEFVLNQALHSMSLLFTEFVGFVLFRALGESVHRAGQRILATHSFATLATRFGIESVKERVEAKTFSERDLLVVLWLAFVDLIGDMVNGDWGQSYRAANVKIRFVFSKATRDLLNKKVSEQNEYMKRRSLKYLWAVGVAEGQGLFEFIKSCVAENR